MKITKILSICAIFSSAIAFSACNSETENTYSTVAFVNYDGSTMDGYTRLLYNVPDGNFYGGSTEGPTVTYLTRADFNEGMMPTIGKRMIGEFVLTIGQELKDGSVLENAGLYSLNKSGDVEIESVTTDPQSQPIYILSLIPSGKYLDIVALAAYQNSDLRLVCDRSTLNTGTPVLYLIYECSQNTTETRYYASFDLSNVLSLPNVENVKIVINNSNSEREFTYPVKQ